MGENEQRGANKTGLIYSIFIVFGVKRVSEIRRVGQKPQGVGTGNGNTVICEGAMKRSRNIQFRLPGALRRAEEGTSLVRLVDEGEVWGGGGKLEFQICWEKRRETAGCSFQWLNIKRRRNILFRLFGSADGAWNM